MSVRISRSTSDWIDTRYRGYVAQNSQGELAFPQTKYLQHVSYIRLKNLQVGYNLPARLVHKAGFSAARAYFSELLIEVNLVLSWGPMP